MKLSKTNTLLLTLMSLLVISGVAFIKPKTEVSAGPRPTNINISTLSEEGIDNYYSRNGGFTNKKGDDLLAELHEVIKGHTEYNYNNDNDRFVYKIIDRNWALSPLTEAELQNFNYANDNPYIHKLYADYNNDPARADRFKNVGATSVSFDKEHIWAQSLGGYGRRYGAGSDFFALWPSDTKGNSPAHSNYNFGTPVIDIKNYNNDKGTYVGRNGYIPGEPNKVFEPLLEYRGDIARAMMYMAARYYVWENEEKPKLKLVNGSPDAIKASPTQPGLAGNLATLLQWHEDDPVSEYEIKRNNLIYYNYQGNRNPFIDRPEWAHIAFDENYVGGGASSEGGTSSSSEELLNVSVSGAPTSLRLGETYNWDNLTFTAHYKEAGATTINKSNSNLTIEYPDTSKLGDQSLNVGFTYGDFTRYASVNVFITNENVEVGEGGDPATDLFISEYIEGGSYNKGIEIYNGTGETVNLSDYTLHIYFNGSTSSGGSLNLSGTLAHEQTFTLTHTSASSAIKDIATVQNGTIGNFNGNDALELHKNGVVIDVFGFVGEDPKTTGWKDPDDTNRRTTDRTLVRRAHNTSPNTTFSWDEWDVYPIDTFTYFGQHDMETVFLGVSKEEQSQAWATYFLSATSGYCEEGAGDELAGSLWNTFASEYALMDSTSKALFKTAIANGDNITDITGAKARYMLLVDTYPALKANNFMVDADDNVIYEQVRVNELSINNETSMFFLVVLGLITITGYFMLTHKRKDASN